MSMRNLAFGMATQVAPVPFSVGVDGVAISAPMSDYYRRVQAGEIQNASIARVFAYNPTVTDTESLVWTSGGPYTGWLTSAAAVRVRAGGNANDTAAGTGARTLTVYGLNETWALASESITLAGASASAATTTTFIRVHRVTVDTVGTYTGGNTGAITIETTGGTLVAAIEAGRSRTTLGLYTIPAGMTGWIFDVRVASSLRNTRQCDFFAYRRHNAHDVTPPYPPRELIARFGGVGSLMHWASSAGESLSERTDFWVDCVRSDSTNTKASCEFAVLLIES